MPRKETFTITAASEMMSILCMSKSLKDLKDNLDSILIGFNTKKEPIYAKDLDVTDSALVLLKDAMKPNLVQTLYNNPVLIHGGPFANIAPGCNTIVATKLGLSLADYTITEAGFGADLGTEKFFNIKCRKAELTPDCVVLVTTIKALKYNAGVKKEDITKEDVSKVLEGIVNLDAHIENLLKQNSNVVVALNKYDTDTEEELNAVIDHLKEMNIPCSLCEEYAKGEDGCIDLANKVIELTQKDNDFKFLYDTNLSIREKIETICFEIYHARTIKFSEKALEKIELYENIGKNDLPICVAKTQYSLSDDPKKLGFPKDIDIEVSDLNIYSGAGFITVLLNNMILLPGLAKHSNYENIKLDDNNEIVGLF